MKAQITLTLTDSKRLTAKSVVEMDALQKARKKGIMAVCRGNSTLHLGRASRFAR